MRLAYFNFTKGNRIAVKFLLNELGIVAGSRIITRAKWRETFSNPLKELNRGRELSKKERLSQRQMGPVVILYQTLLEEGYSKDYALNLLRGLTKEVAIAFLDFNIPQISRKNLDGKMTGEKKRFLDRVFGRFFNARGKTGIEKGDLLKIDIEHCYFASYAMQLGLPELGPLFCETDKFYFDNYQREVQFDRTQTLAIDGKPCDFRFKWKEES